MASGIVKDIDEKFCECSICLEQFKEPKLLPCLHRFCKKCLAVVIMQCRGNLLCPVCREEFIVPKEGLEGFKTDFYMKNIIEYVRLQSSLEDNHMQECYGCSKTLKVSAYCFKCNDFLCKECHQFHVTSKITQDHRPHTLAVEDVISKRLTFDKLASLKKSPRCYTHSEKLSELCCKTCNNMPICIACTYGNHKSHNLYEVTALANEDRQKLEQKLAEVCSFEKGILQMPEKLDKLKSDIDTAVADQIKFTQSEYLKREVSAKEKLLFIVNERKRSKNEKEIALNEELKLIEKEKENEIQKINEKYDKICEEKRQMFNEELQTIQLQHNEEASLLQERLATYEIAYKEARASLEKQQHDNLAKIQQISEHFENTIKRLQNIKATASSTLQMKNDWTAVMCIPDICAACNALIVDMGKQFPDLETMVDIKMKSLSLTDFDNQFHTQDQTSAVAIFGIAAKGWNICDIAVNRNGKIVITGNAALHKSHITVVDKKGNVICQWVMSNVNSTFEEPERFGTFLSEDTLATTCDPTEVGLFDIRDGSYTKKNLSDFTDWPAQRGVTCIASDPVKKRIIVGSWLGSHVCVLDDQLNFLLTIALPEPLRGAMYVLLNKHDLLIGCFQAQKAIAFKRVYKGAATRAAPRFYGRSRHVFEFQKPVDDESDWRPLHSCKDKGGCIYVLWSNGSYLNRGRRIMAKYRSDNCHLIAIKEVDKDTYRFTTYFSDRETLLVTTYSAGKMYEYDALVGD